MKRLLPAALILWFSQSFILLAQNPVPNPGLENWNGSSITGWTSNNLGSIAEPVTKSTDAKSGSSAVKLAIVDAMGSPYPGQITSTNGGIGFPVSSKYSSFKFYYKLNVEGNNITAISLTFDDSLNAPVGSGLLRLNSSNNTNVYTQATVPLTMIGNTPVEALISIAMGASTGTPTVGSYIIIDDMELVATSTGNNDRMQNAMPAMQNPFPNPANDSAFLPFSIQGKSTVNISIYNLNGSLTKEIVNDSFNTGNYKAEINCADLASGIYVIELNDGQQSLKKKVIVSH